MKLGVFAKTYQRKSLEATLDAVRADGINLIQLKMTSVGLPTLPEQIPQSIIDRIKRATESRGISIAAISATYNMAHPDPAVRDRGTKHLRVLAKAAQSLGVPTLSLCTGTRNLDDIWTYHPDNELDEAWEEMFATIDHALKVTEDSGVNLAIEPEPGNIVKDASEARYLIKDIDNPRLGSIIDPANLVAIETGPSTAEIIAEAVSLLGESLLMVHAKDCTRAAIVRPPGQGIVPWESFLRQLQEIGFDGPLMMHGFDEADVPGAIAYLSPIVANLSSPEQH